MERRADISNALVHLTRARKEYGPWVGLEPPKVQRTVPAFEVLKEILISGIIRGSGNSGYIKGHKTATCFSEAPLSAVPRITEAIDGNAARYMSYGVAISKKAVFEAGGRPVIYLPDSEGTWIPDDEKWRHVRFEFNNVDFTYEREWRAPGDFDLTTVPGLYVLVWSAPEAKQIYGLASPVQHLIRGVLPMKHLSEFL